MNSNSFLDVLGQLFQIGINIGPMLPGVLFNIGVLWLSILGWQKHRASGFLFLLTAAAVGLTSSLIWLSVLGAGSRSLSPHSLSAHRPILMLAGALGPTSMIFWIAGLWCLVYRTRFAPPEHSDQSQP